MATPTEISQLVQDYLQRQQPRRIELEVVPEWIRHENDWWYVPVRPSKSSPTTFEYYTVLSEVEAQLEENEQINILLVPAAA